jgi:hypothetical protein
MQSFTALSLTPLPSSPAFRAPLNDLGEFHTCYVSHSWCQAQRIGFVTFENLMPASFLASDTPSSMAALPDTPASPTSYHPLRRIGEDTFWNVLYFCSLG